jgi:hypothetical protein
MQKFKYLFSCAAVLALVSASILFSCGDRDEEKPPVEAPVEEIAVTPDKILLVVGKTQELTATAVTIWVCLERF